MKAFSTALILVCLSSILSAQTSIIVNPDGTHSTVFHNGATSTVVNPNGTLSTVFHNGPTSVMVNPDGTNSTIFHNGSTSTIVNPNGTHSTVFHSGSSSLVVNPDGTHTQILSTDSVQAVAQSSTSVTISIGRRTDVLNSIECSQVQTVKNSTPTKQKRRQRRVRGTSR